ncbi:MAG: alpha/beta fold hydrolase [Blastocatellia bacterium]|nr:alpha/beta fold hydrolase [Blastocatellia bacterium]
MKRKRLKINELLSLLFLLISLQSIFAQSKAGELKVEPFIFEAGNGSKIEAERGFVSVPENRQKPNSRLIEIGFVRFKSTSPNPKSPVVYLAGGPGSSGIGTARGSRFPLFMAMREVADVIALDQRGVGQSKPNLNCKETINYPLEETPNREGFAAHFQEKFQSCIDNFRKQDVDLSGYNTNENADDIEDLRKAIAAKQISLWAISYGTHLSLATVKRHPKSIDRMILAGVEGLSDTLKLPSNIQKHLDYLDQLAKKDADLSREIPSLLSLMKTVLDKVEREPVTIETTDPQTKQKVKVTINKFVLQMLTGNSFGSGEASIPQIYQAMSRGDFSFAVFRWLSLTRGGQGIGSAMSLMMDCASGISSKRRQQIAREAKTTLLGDVMNFPFPDVCKGFENVDLGEKFRAPVKTNIPTLFISGTLDVRTPVSNAENVRKGFKTSEHLIIEGAVHSDPLFLSSPKIKDVMLEFMKGQKISTNKISLEPLKFAQISNKN